MDTAAIVAQGTYVPGLRVEPKEVAQHWGHAPPRGVAALAVARFDEDVVTLAVEAARRALAAWSGKPEDLALVLFATSGEEAGAPVVAQAVGATAARAMNVTQSPTSGVAALVTAFDTAEAGLLARQRAPAGAPHAPGYPVLVVASDVPRVAPGESGEAALGAAAVAFVVAPGQGVRLARAGAASGRPGDPDGDRALLARARDELGERPPTPAFELAADGTSPSRAHIGDTGAARALLDLVLASRTPGEGIVECVGPGSALALRVHVDAPPAGESPGLESGRAIPYVRMLQERAAFLEGLQLSDAPMGAFVSEQAFEATLPARWRLIAQKCRSCAHLDYPPRATCRRCTSTGFTDVPLSGRASLYTFTAIARGGGPSEFAAEQAMRGELPVGVVEFEEGLRVAAALADVDAIETLRIGIPLEGAFRRLYVQDKKPRYGMKFKPV